MSEEKVKKQVVLPLSEAFKMSMRSIKVRFGRVVIVSASVFLGVAFLVSILTNSSVNEALIEHGPEQVSLALSAEADDTRTRDVWLVTLSLLVCVVGITNAMLMAVSERSREIGTMKCLGALNKFIMNIFLIEAALQGMLGSLAGALLGTLSMLILFMIRFGGSVFVYAPYPALAINILFAVILGTIIAVIGAIYPTYLSARLQPAEAIRREV